MKSSLLSYGYEWIMPGQEITVSLTKGQLMIALTNQMYLKKKIIIKDNNALFGHKFHLLNKSNVPKCIYYYLLEFHQSIDLEDFYVKVLPQNVINLLKSHISNEALTHEVKEILNKITKYFIGNDEQLKNQTFELDPTLIKIHRYIRKNYNKPITLQDIATVFSYNPVYLSNTYSKVFKISPMTHLQSIRMERAAYLLINTNKSIRKISVEVTYSSLSHFSSIFKKYHGFSPRKYRLMNRNDNNSTNRLSE